MRLLLALFLAACSPEDQAPDPLDPAALETVRLVVVYEEGAEPYTGPAGPGQGDTWSLFETNAAALFEGSGVDVVAERQPEQMLSFANDGVGGYPVDAILDLARAQATPGLAGGTRTVVALWLDGRLVDEEGNESDTVLGVSVGATSVVAMFKPVIESVGAVELVRRFGEQTVLIHEFGHAVGLVNNGAPLTAEHQDEAHGAHCSDDRCVMFWANEGVADLAEFVQQVVTSGSTVVFGQDCLADARGWYGGE